MKLDSVDAALATSTDSDYEAVQGLTPTAQAALLDAPLSARDRCSRDRPLPGFP